MTYTVTWEIDVDDEDIRTPRDAALHALEDFKSASGVHWTWTVTDAKGNKFTIDLDNDPSPYGED